MIFPLGCLTEWRQLCGKNATSKDGSWARMRVPMVQLKKELDQANRTGIARELARLVYSAYDMALAFDIDLDDAFNETHLSNLTLVHDGKVEFAHGEPVRPPRGFKWPNLARATATRHERGVLESATPRGTQAAQERHLTRMAKR